MARVFRRLGGAALLPLLLLTVAPASASAEPARDLELLLEAKRDEVIGSFYANRGHMPLWTTAGKLKPGAETLLEILKSSPADGFVAGPAIAGRIESIVAQGKAGRASDLAAVDYELSRAWVDYVSALHARAGSGMTYAEPRAAPHSPDPATILIEAANAPSLPVHLRAVSKLNPFYDRLRGMLVAESGQRPLGRSGSSEREDLIKLNLERARDLGPAPSGKYVVVDAAAQTMWLYEGDRLLDSMRVAVGKPDEPTPMMAGLLREAILNPYWNVPPDLVRKRIAPNVLKLGVGYLKSKRYEVLSDWSENARVVNPADVDWESVAEGRSELRVRQLPGSGNMMGMAKFMFPNEQGIYLHDTPDKSVFEEDRRSVSSGCVRLEDARRLGSWLLGDRFRSTTASAEERINLPAPVPVFITYFTVSDDAGKMVLRPDVYGRDKSLASLMSSRSASMR